MEEQKNKRKLKIFIWIAIAVVVLTIIAMCIAAAVIKDKNKQLSQDNQQIEDILDQNQPSSQQNKILKNCANLVDNIFYT